MKSVSLLILNENSICPWDRLCQNGVVKKEGEEFNRIPPNSFRKEKENY